MVISGAFHQGWKEGKKERSARLWSFRLFPFTFLFHVSVCACLPFGFIRMRKVGQGVLCYVVEYHT